MGGIANTINHLFLQHLQFASQVFFYFLATWESRNVPLLLILDGFEVVLTSKMCAVSLPPVESTQLGLYTANFYVLRHRQTMKNRPHARANTVLEDNQAQQQQDNK